METNTKKKKTLTTALAVAVAALLLIGGGTFAYLQSQSDDTVNTFSTNKVTVTLTEPAGAENGYQYDIIPGTEQTKDPKVSAEATVDAYVYVTVTDDTDGLVEYTIAEGWRPLDGVDNVYYQEISANQEFEDVSVLAGDKVTYSANIENSDMLDTNGDLKDGIKLTFKASAVQKKPFNNPVKAFYQADDVVETGNELKQAITDAEDGDTIAVIGEVNLTAPLTISSDVTITGDDSTLISGSPITTKADVTFVDVAFEKPVNANHNATTVYGQAGTEELVFEGCTFSDPQWEVLQITSNDFKSLVVNNCTFTAANVDGATSSYGNTADQAIRYIHIQPSTHKEAADIKITNNTFRNCNKVKDSIVGIYYVSTESTITVGGNSFEGWAAEDVENGVTPKLSIGWPEVETLKTISNWTGENKTFKIDSNAN